MKKAFKQILTLLIFWLAMVALPSHPTIRDFLARPLIVTEPSAEGDLVYILAGGQSFWERVFAAADLYHMGRVKGIMLLGDDTPGAVNFVARTKWSKTQWTLGYLNWLGVPQDAVLVLRGHRETVLGTLGEAEFVGKNLPKDVQHLVIVTSTPHTRRAMLAFRRVVSDEIRLVPYAATSMRKSAELHYPLWVEYVKLAVYAILA